MSQMPKWQNLFVVNLLYPELCDSPCSGFTLCL